MPEQIIPILIVGFIVILIRSVWEWKKSSNKTQFIEKSNTFLNFWYYFNSILGASYSMIGLFFWGKRILTSSLDQFILGGLYFITGTSFILFSLKRFSLIGFIFWLILMTCLLSFTHICTLIEYGYDILIFKIIIQKITHVIL